MKTCFSITLATLIYLSTVSCEKLNDSDTLNGNPNDTIPVLIDTCISDTCHTCDLIESAESIYYKLLNAYSDSCVNCLELILAKWEDKYPVKVDIPDSVQDVYEVYKEFYSPWDLGRISESEFGDNIYSGYSHYVIQNTIKYNYNFRSYSSEHFTLNDFRPSIKNDTVHVYYLKEDYANALNCFLGSEYLSLGSGNIMSPALPDGESYLRYKFLNNYLFFFHGHWGNYWHFETHPEVERISFNAERDSAQVHFRLGYQGGEVILGKKEGNWIITDHYMTWIE